MVWKRAIGEGYSGMSVAGDRLYTMDSDGTTEYVWPWKPAAARRSGAFRPAPS